MEAVGGEERGEDADGRLADLERLLDHFLEWAPRYSREEASEQEFEDVAGVPLPEAIRLFAEHLDRIGVVDHDDEKRFLLESRADIVPDYCEFFREGVEDYLVEPPAPYLENEGSLRTLIRGDRFTLQIPFLDVRLGPADLVPAMDLCTRAPRLGIEERRGPRLLDLGLEMPRETLRELRHRATHRRPIDLGEMGVMYPRSWTGEFALALRVSVEARRWSDVAGLAAATAAEVFGALIALRLAETVAGGWDRIWLPRLSWTLGTYDLRTELLGRVANRLSLATKRGEEERWVEQTGRLRRVYDRGDDDENARSILRACWFLAQSTLAWNPGEKALALCSGLEALLLDPDTRNRRKARLIETASSFVGAALEDRRSVTADLTDAYKLRSKYVHTGRIDHALEEIARRQREDSAEPRLPAGRALRALLDRVESYVVTAIEKSFREMPA